MLDGNELRYELKVTPQIKMMGKPRTKLAVRIAKTAGTHTETRTYRKPKTLERYRQQEVDFLDRVERSLPVMDRGPTEAVNQ